MKRFVMANLGLWILLLLAAGGCGPYARLQASLVTQGREGLRRVEAARSAESTAVTKLLAERRERLDRAFDADVAAQASLDAAWVIEARKAYAIGLDGLADQRARHVEADAAAKDNAAAADEAFALLERMLRTQERIRIP